MTDTGGQLSYVQAVLRRWDPIGVFIGMGDDPDCAWRDEYDSYAPQLLTLLSHQARVNTIERELRRIRTQAMGLPPRADLDHPVAAELVCWWRGQSEG